MSEERTERTEEKPQPVRTYDYGAAAAAERARITEKYNKLHSGVDPLVENKKIIFGDEWGEREGSPELAAACAAFQEETGLTDDNPVWKKMNDLQFFGRDADILNLHEKKDYDAMLRLARERAERAVERDGRRDYLRWRQEQALAVRGGGGESFEARRAKAGR
jgi:hypothetical protein